MPDTTSEVIPFKRNAVRAYLDTSIQHWRSVRDGNAEPPIRIMATHYIDAFQSVRCSLFGSVLIPEERTKTTRDEGEVA